MHAARRTLGVLVALLAALALAPALGQAAVTGAAIGFPESSPPAPGLTPAFKEYRVGVTGVAQVDIWAAASGWGFQEGAQRGHCVQNGAFSVAAPGVVRSGADIALTGDAATAEGERRVRWLLFSSRQSVDAGVDPDLEAAAHQAAIWKLTDPGEPLGQLPPNTQQPPLTDPAALARAQALLDASAANAAAVDNPATVAVLGQDACVGVQRIVRLTGVPFTDYVVALTGGAEFAGGGTERAGALPGTGTVDLAVVGTSPGQVTVSAQMHEATMFQADNDPENGLADNQDYVFPLFRTVTRTTAFAVRECPLSMSATATPAFTRTFPWTIAKSASPQTQTVTGGTATIAYQVTVTKGAPVDSGFAVAGTITLANPRPEPVGGVDVTARIGAVACTVIGGSGASVPPEGVLALTYECALGSPTGDPVLITATGFPDVSVPVVFGAPTTVTGNAVDVTDTPLGQPAVGLGLSDQTRTFSYTREVAVPASGCATLLNTAAFATTDSPPARGEATASAEVCRTGPGGGVLQPSGTPSGTPSRPVVRRAALVLDKRAPARASAGQVMSYTVTVRNRGRAAARAVVVSDPIPGAVALTGRAAGARLTGGRLVWRAGTLAPGASRTYRFTVRIATTARGRQCNTATAGAANAPRVRDRACTLVSPIGNRVQPAVTG